MRLHMQQLEVWIDTIFALFPPLRAARLNLNQTQGLIQALGMRELRIGLPEEDKPIWRGQTASRAIPSVSDKEGA